MKKTTVLLIAALFFCTFSYAQEQVARWGVFELSLKGSENSNPFINTSFSAIFRHGDKVKQPEGFYDGNGLYKIRFMPDEEGEWTYTTKSNKEELNNKSGSFICTPAEKENHGPVSVHNKFYFSYADNTCYIPFGTTLYEWAFQSSEKKMETLSTLRQSPFNKVRMLAVPPYHKRYVEGPGKLTVFPFAGTEKANFDFSRFNPLFFQQLEKDIQALQKLNIEVDLILFRPYDGGKWGFDQMDRETNDRFLRYIIARLGAYHNIWWSLSNENSFIKHLTDEDWDHYFQTVQQFDPYQHLRSIHNADRIYDYKKPWVTHVSLQYYNVVRVFGVSPLLRDIYQKPIVHDEINYEGNVEKRWGQLSGEELAYRFWTAYIGGAYATHGEAQNEGWISIGGKLNGTSPERIAFLKKVMETAPTDWQPLDQYYLLNAVGKYGTYYLYYFGKETPSEWVFSLPDEALKDGMKFKVELIDTWNMTVKPVDKVYEVQKKDNYSFIDKQKSKVKLPGKPYMAIRITRTDIPVIANRAEGEEKIPIKN